MKKVLIAAALLAVIPWSAEAQVEKQVEVTKAYVPSLESAAKLGIAPDMTDTARMRPEIDYTITPLSLRTTLQTRPIRPATVTYWEFNRPLPFYLKVGAGYPSNSVLDFYGSSQNPGTGYVVGYVNHEGRYAKIKNDFDVKNNSLRMTNRAGVAAGKYLGRRVLEGDLSYENRVYHRYGDFVTPGLETLSLPGGLVNFGDANLALRFGDDFQDLSRTNFEIAVHGGLFMNRSEIQSWEDREDTQATPRIVKSFEKSRQLTLGASGKIARGFGKHRFSVEAGYERWAGYKAISDYMQQQIRAGVRYGLDGGVVQLEAGADYYHDKVEGGEAGNYIIPYLRLGFNLGTAGLRPFLELDGGVLDNGFRSLMLRNPYVKTAWGNKSSVDYNGRIGIGGSLWRNRFTYRVYAGVSIRDNHLYWAADRFIGRTYYGSYVEAGSPFSFYPARQTVTSFHGEIEWRPISVLRVDIGVHGYLYNDSAVQKHTPLPNLIKNDNGTTMLENGEPAFRGNLGVRYEGRKIAFGVAVMLESERKWTTLGSPIIHFDGSTEREILVPSGTFEAPFAADLRVDFEWKVSGRVSIFAEGRNLLNRKLYQFPFYPEYGANFTAGVKLNF